MLKIQHKNFNKDFQHKIFYCVTFASRICILLLYMLRSFG